MKLFLMLAALLVIQPFDARAAEPEIADGLTPKHASGEIAELVLGKISSPVQGARRNPDGAVAPVPAIPEIVSMNLVRGSDVRSVLPESGIGSLPYAQVWVVRAKGDFINLRTSRAGKPSRATAGFYIIDDATKAIVGRGSFADPSAQ